MNGRILDVELSTTEISLKRSLFDQLLMTRARELGAIVFESTTVTALSAPDNGNGHWTIVAGEKTFEARMLVAADGRNSTVARLCGLLPRSEKERIALQTHLPLPADFGDRIVLQFLPEGYSGQAPVGCGELNLCLVSVPRKMAALRKWAEARFGIAPDHSWRTITPLTRDAARVVEPFTGEGIYYALASGELAADAIVSQCNGRGADEVSAAYSAAHEKLYRGRLWVNRLARAAVLSPILASTLLGVMRLHPALLHRLTGKIVAPHRHHSG